MPLAEAARSKARALVEARLAKEPANDTLAADLADVLLIDTTRWTMLKPAETKSQGGATLTPLEDNSILASGPNPDKAVYTLTFRDLPARVQYLRLDVLPHDSLPAAGPGRSPDGNFVVTTIEAQLDPLTNKNGVRRLKLARALADYSQDNWNVDGAIDANDNTGWAIAPFMSKPHFALVELAEPVTETVGSVLRVTLEFKSPHKQYALGRFRLSVSPDPAAFDREAQRLAAVKLTDPWAKLAAAYALDGRSDKSA